MKRIEAIVRPDKVAGILTALNEIGHPGLMVTEIEGHGKQKGVEHEIRGKTYKVELLTKSRIEMIVKDNEMDDIIRTIRSAALTGKVGDGKIFVYPVDNVVRIRTGEQGDIAV